MVKRQLGRGVRSAARILITARVILIAECCEGLAYASRRKRRSPQTSDAHRTTVARTSLVCGEQLETDKIWRQCDV